MNPRIKRFLVGLSALVGALYLAIGKMPDGTEMLVTDLLKIPLDSWLVAIYLAIAGYVKGDDNYGRKENDDPCIESVGQILGFDEQSPVERISQAEQNQESQDIGCEKIDAVKTGNHIRHMKCGKDPANYEFQGVRLHRQKSEKYQGMGQSRREFAPDIALSEHIGKQRLNPLGDSIQLKGSISLNTAHQGEESFNPGEKQTECRHNRNCH